MALRDDPATSAPRHPWGARYHDLLASRGHVVLLWVSGFWWLLGWVVLWRKGGVGMAGGNMLNVSPIAFGATEQGSDEAGGGEDPLGFLALVQNHVVEALADESGCGSDSPRHMFAVEAALVAARSLEGALAVAHVDGLVDALLAWQGTCVAEAGDDETAPVPGREVVTVDAGSTLRGRLLDRLAVVGGPSEVSSNLCLYAGSYPAMRSLYGKVCRYQLR